MHTSTYLVGECLQLSLEPLLLSAVLQQGSIEAQLLSLHLAAVLHCPLRCCIADVTHLNTRKLAQIKYILNVLNVVNEMYLKLDEQRILVPLDT